MSIITKTGDSGTTGLFGGGRISKNSPRLHACGTVDELNAALGLALAEDLPQDIGSQLTRVQRVLFDVGTDLATPWGHPIKVKRLTAKESEELEQWTFALETQLPELRRFILPSGSRAGSLLHLARTICRRAERWTVALAENENINAGVRVYLNRLSDYLFMAARKVNHAAGAKEMEVTLS